MMKYPQEEFIRRLVATADNLPSDHKTAFLSCNKHDICWLTGFMGSFGYALLVPNGLVYLITDGRYAKQALSLKSKILAPLILNSGEQLDSVLNEICSANHIERLFVADELPFILVARIRTGLAAIQVESVSSVIDQLRSVKSCHERQKLQDLCVLTDRIMLMAKDNLRPGVSEADIAALIVREILATDSSLAFLPIVAFGENSANPHAIPGGRLLAQDEVALIDFGMADAGVNSDITRTFYLGSPSPEVRHRFEAVLSAQQIAIQVVKHGNLGASVDNAGRQLLAQRNLDQYFIHTMGHTLPTSSLKLSIRSSVVLQQNEAWTIEPGIYIDGWGGIRFEDDVLVDLDGCTVLTNAPRDWILD